MNDDILPVVLLSSDRMSDPGWPGVLVRVGADRRVCVNAAGTRYAFQRSGASDFGERWGGASYATLAALLRVNAKSCAGLSEACSRLPDSPALAMPDLQAAQADLSARFDATDFRHGDYARVICQDGNMRLIVEPDGLCYRIQWISAGQYVSGACDEWHTQRMSSFASELLAWFDVRVFCRDYSEGLPAPELRQALCSVPENASDGVWSDLSERPPTVRRGRRFKGGFGVLSD